MSDEDDFLSEESYEFEFEDEDEDVIQNETPDQTSAENKYYYAKSLKEDLIDSATQQMKALIASADENSEIEWIFKANKQLAKMAYHQHKFDEMLEYIANLIKLLPKLNGNYAEESISKILHRYSACADQRFVLRMYDVIVSHLQDSMALGVAGQRLWIRINMNRLRNFLENGPLDQCSLLISAINKKLESLSELTQNSYILDIIAAEIEFTFKTDMDLLRLSYLHRKAAKVSSNITHPRVMGVIKECSATIHFHRRNFETARVEFYECFKNYDEAGSSSKKRILKYLSLCLLLTENEVNPFESQETQSYASLPEYRNLIQLVGCCENLDLKRYLAVIDRMAAENDSLIHDNIFKSASQDILHNLKVRILLNLLKAYRSIRFELVSRKLQLENEDQLESLFIKMANSGTCRGIKVDFTNRYIETEQNSTEFFPSTFDASDVQRNLHVVSAIGFHGLWNGENSESANAMDIDFTSNLEDKAVSEAAGDLSVINAVIFPSRLGSRLSEWTLLPGLVEEWFGFMKSTFPALVQTTVSQKEKVYSEQQEDAANLSLTKESTKEEVLDTHFHMSEDEEEAIDKVETLQRWAKKIHRGLR